MTRDDIIRMAQEADFEIDDARSGLLKVWVEGVNITDAIECFAALVAAEKEAQMIRDGWRKCAEGQRTTQFCGLLDAAVKAEREKLTKAAMSAAKIAIEEAMELEREACAKLCEEKQTYSMSIPCPDGISGCCVNHVVPASREKTGTECATAIRARGDV